MSNVLEKKYYPRFRVFARIEHIVLLLSFTILAITGLPQRFAESLLSQNLINLMGGIETVRLIHRWAAVFLVLGSAYHLVMAIYRLYVKGERMRIMLRVSDASDLANTLSYNLGFRDEPPKMTKFNFGEKIEYWAVIWGTAVMVITGFVLWNPIAVTEILPGQFIPAAKAAHGGEAILAVLSILVWHMYNVLVKHRNFSIFTGYLPREQMKEEHGLELERLEAGGDPYPGLQLPAPAKRQRNFVIFSVLLGIVAIAAVYWMFTFEETAITTIPQVTRDIFVPLGTPVP